MTSLFYLHANPEVLQALTAAIFFPTLRKIDLFISQTVRRRDIARFGSALVSSAVSLTELDLDLAPLDNLHKIVLSLPSLITLRLANIMDNLISVPTVKAPLLTSLELGPFPIYHGVRALRWAKLCPLLQTFKFEINEQHFGSLKNHQEISAFCESLADGLWPNLTSLNLALLFPSCPPLFLTTFLTISRPLRELRFRAQAIDALPYIRSEQLPRFKLLIARIEVVPPEPPAAADSDHSDFEDETEAL